MLSLPVPRAFYSLSKGFNRWLSMGTSHAPVESGTPGTFRPLSLISKEIRNVSPHPEQTGPYRPETLLPLRAAGIRWNPLFVKELRERVASVAALRNDASGVSRPGAASSSQDQSLHPASSRADARASFAKGDMSAMRAQTSVAGHTQETGKSGVAETATVAMAPASKLTTDFASLTSPGLVPAQQRAYEKSRVAAAPGTAATFAATVPPVRSRSRTQPLAALGATVHSRSRSAPQERSTTAKATQRSWSAEELRHPQRNTEVVKMLSGIGALCYEAEERIRAMSDSRLAIDLSRTFGDRLFRPDEVRAWRQDVATMSDYAKQYLKKPGDLITLMPMKEGEVLAEKHSLDEMKPSSKKSDDKNSLTIDCSFFDKGEAHAILSAMRAMAKATGRRETLVFPFKVNQGPMASTTSPYGVFPELDAFCRAGIGLHGELLSGRADADIDRAAVLLGCDLPDGHTDHSLDEDARKEVLKALQRDDGKIEAIIKSNCDSLVQYVIRCATRPR